MPDDLAATVIADGGQTMDGAFEAVERMRRSGRHDLEGEVVVVAADFTLSHGSLPGTGQPALPTLEDWLDVELFASGR